MSLPSKKTVRSLIKSGDAVCARIHAIARNLEALEEYNPEQAMLVAADIVRNSCRVVSDHIAASSAAHLKFELKV